MPTVEELEFELAKVKAENTELTQAIEAGRTRYASLENSITERVEEESERKLAEKIAQDKAVAEDAARRASPRVVTRPQTWSEYQSLSISDRVKALDLFGGEELLAELHAQQRAANEQMRRDEVQRKLASQKPKFERD